MSTKKLLKCALQAGMHAIFVCVLFFCLMPRACLGQEVVVPHGRDFVNLTPAIELFYDPGGDESLADVMADGAIFKPGRVPAATFGTGQGRLWGRVRLDLAGEPGPQRWRLLFNLTYVDHADIYVIGADGRLLAHARRGLRLGVPEDGSLYHWVDLTPFESAPVTLYIRLQSRFSLRLDAFLLTDGANARVQGRMMLTHGLLAGAMLVMATLFGGMALFTRDSLHAHGFLLALSLTAIDVFTNGLNRPLGLTSVVLDDWIVTNLAILGVHLSLPLFIARFCSTDRNHPRLFQWGRAALILLVLAEGGMIFFQPNRFLGFSTGIFYGVLVLVAGMVLLDRRVERSVRISAVLAVIPFAVCAAVYLVAFNFWIPSLVPFTGLMTHLLSISIALLLIGFAVAVGMRNKARLEAMVALRTVQLAEATAETESALARERNMRQRMQTFIEMATHEFKTPLAIIDSAAQVLELKLGTGRPEIVRRVGSIRRAVRRLVSLIEICLLSERDSSLSLNACLVAPDSVLTRVVERNRDPERADLVIETSALPPLCRIDPELLGVALDVLIDNARRYAPGRDPITLDAHGEAGGIIVFAVHDRGPGVAPDEEERVFEKYYRGSSSQGASGTGLGLYLVRAVATLHGGRANYRPRPGGGASFSLTLPTMGGQRRMDAFGDATSRRERGMVGGPDR
jgi:two-component system, sensor histidine kinase LadS